MGSPQSSMCLLKERRVDEVQAKRLFLILYLSPFRVSSQRGGCFVMKGRNEINRIHLRCSFPSSGGG